MFKHSKIVTDTNTSKIKFYQGAFNDGFLTLFEGCFHEMVHVRQNAVLKHGKSALLSLCLPHQRIVLAPSDEIQNPRVRELLKVAHHEAPANRYEMSWGTLSESMAYRAALYAVLTFPGIAEGDSFLSHVSRSMQSRSWTDDPWEATQLEMERQVSSERGRPFQLQSLVARTGMGRLQLHPEAYSILGSINNICTQGEHVWHGRLTVKALMATWPDVVRLLDDDDHPDSGVLRTFESALTWATKGWLGSGCTKYAEKLGLSRQMLLEAHQKVTLTKGLEHLAATALRENSLGASLVLRAIEQALSSDEVGMRPEDSEIYRSALRLTVAPDAAQGASSSMSGSG